MSGLVGPGLPSGVRRLDTGGVRVRLTPRERDLLRSLPVQLRPLVAGERDLDTSVGWVGQRLFPAAYEDPLDDYDYRELVGSSISDERAAALDAFAETLEGGTARRFTWSVDLDEERAHAWLSAVNDARLVLAMVLGVTEDGDWADRVREGDPTGMVLAYLGWLQEELLTALMPGLRGPHDGTATPPGQEGEPPGPPPAPA